MKYAIFTQYEFWFKFYCDKIIAEQYPGYRTLPMLKWTHNHVVLRDGTDIRWINTRCQMSESLCGLRFQRIFIVDGVSDNQLAEITARWQVDSLLT